MGCTSSHGASEDQTRRVIAKFEPTMLSNVDVGDLPRLVIGRVAPSGNVLVSPMKKAQCVLYRLIVEEAISGKWMHVCTDLTSSDFFLMDPASPGASVHIASTTAMQLYAYRDVRDRDNSAAYEYPEELSPIMQSILARHGITRKQYNHFRIRETIIASDDQLVALGIVQDGVAANGANVRLMQAAPEDALSLAFCEEFSWSGADIRAWQELSASNQLIISDDIVYFKGISIRSLVGVVPGIKSKQVSVRPPSPSPGRSNANTTTTTTSTTESNHIRTPVGGATFNIKVPEGAVPGSMIRVPSPDGASIQVKVPDDAKPGQIIQVSL